MFLWQERFQKKVIRLTLIAFICNAIMPVFAQAPERKVKHVSSFYRMPGHVDVSPEVLGGLDIKKVLQSILTKAQEEGILEQMPSGLLRCYQSLERRKTVDRKDLEESFPFIVYSLLPNWMIDHDGELIEKAPRPFIEGENPIVGAAACDISQVLSGLSKLKKILCQKFEETWTMLEDIKETTCDKFEETWTVLDDIKETMCDKFEETWTMLEDIKETTCNKFEETWTVLDDIKEMICDKFEETWTMLEDIKEATCNKFEETWTIFDGIKETMCDKFEETWTMLEDIKETTCNKFEETWTVLDDIKETMCDKFEETWTMLEDIKEATCNKFEETWTIFDDIKETMCDKLEETWTMLEDIKETTCNKFEETWTIFDDIEEMICDKFEETWTMLEDIKEATCDKFNKTWTVLDEIDQDIQECCESLQEDFRQTWTMIEDVEEIMCGKFDGTFSSIHQLQETVEECCQEIQDNFERTWTIIEDIKETMCDKFEETWTMIENLEIRMDIDLNEVFTTIEESKRVICDKFEETWTMIQNITIVPEPSACAPIPLFQDLVQNGTLMILEPGVYCLAENITGEIIIDADRVTLDLNGKQVSSTNGEATISSVCHENIIIKDGFLQGNGTTERGIWLRSCPDVKILCVDFKNYFTGLELGVFVEKRINEGVTSFVVDSCFFSTNVESDRTEGICLNQVFNGTVRDCKIADVDLDTMSRFTGIRISGCRDIILDSIQISKVTAGSVYGVFCDNFSRGIKCINSVISDIQVTGVFSVLESSAIVVDFCDDITLKDCCFSRIEHTVFTENLTVVNIINSVKVIIDHVQVTENKIIPPQSVASITKSGATGSLCGIALVDSNNCCITNNLIKANRGIFEARGISIDDQSSSNTIRRNIFKSNENFGIFNNSTSSVILQNEAQDHTVANYGGTEVPVHRIVKLDPAGGGKFDRAPKEFDNISVESFVGDDVCCPCINEFEQTWTILENITVAMESPCAPIPLFQSMVQSGTLLIAEPGTYCLAENIFGAIVIDSSNVTLDLNNKEVAYSDSGPIVLISEENKSFLKEITIKNGLLTATNTSGSTIGIFSENIDCLKIFSVKSNAGFAILDSSNIKIQHCVINNGSNDIDGPFGEMFYRYGIVLSTSSLGNAQIDDCTINSGNVDVNTYGVLVNGFVGASIINSVVNIFSQSSSFGVYSNSALTSVRNTQCSAIGAKESYGVFFDSKAVLERGLSRLVRAETTSQLGEVKDCSILGSGSLEGESAGIFVSGLQHTIENVTALVNLRETNTCQVTGIKVGGVVDGEEKSSESCIISNSRADCTFVSTGTFVGIDVTDFAVETIVERNKVVNTGEPVYSIGIKNDSDSTVITGNTVQDQDENYGGFEVPVHRIVKYDSTDGGKFDRTPKEFDNISVETFVGDDVCCPCINQFQETWTIFDQVTEEVQETVFQEHEATKSFIEESLLSSGQDLREKFEQTWTLIGDTVEAALPFDQIDSFDKVNDLDVSIITLLKTSIAAALGYYN